VSKVRANSCCLQAAHSVHGAAVCEQHIQCACRLGCKQLLCASSTYNLKAARRMRCRHMWCTSSTHGASSCPIAPQGTRHKQHARGKQLCGARISCDASRTKGASSTQEASSLYRVQAAVVCKQRTRCREQQCASKQPTQKSSCYAMQVACKQLCCVQATYSIRGAGQHRRFKQVTQSVVCKQKASCEKLLRSC
jgi:hypothetical protein